MATTGEVKPVTNFETFTVKQVQEKLGLSERSIFRLIDKEELQGTKVGREWRFTEEDITAYLHNQREKAKAQLREKKAKRAERAKNNRQLRKGRENV
jgi:excisionase family DNA binding protein